MESTNNNFASNLIHIILIFFIIAVIYLHIKHVNISLILDNENYSKSNKIIRNNKIKNKEININTSTNQSVIPYTDKDMNQKVYMKDDSYLNIGESIINLSFIKNKDYNIANYEATEVYKLGDVVTVDDKGRIRDFINLVIDTEGCINQDPLKDSKAWLEIFILL